MQYPVQVTFKDMPISDATEALCWAEAEKLEQFFPRLTGCRVVIAEPHRRRQQGNLFTVRIDLTVPGGEIVVNREPTEHQRHEDVQVAIREAFDTARRELKKHADRYFGVPKHREAPPTGQVCRLFPDRGYGFIETCDGREVYFHRNSVLNDAFDRMESGDEVRFTEEEGIEGPQASTVHHVGHRHQIAS